MRDPGIIWFPTYCCKTTLNISLHLHINSFGHVHLAVLGVSVKHCEKRTKEIVITLSLTKKCLAYNNNHSDDGSEGQPTFAEMSAAPGGQDVDEDRGVRALPLLARSVQSSGVAVGQLVIHSLSPPGLQATKRYDKHRLCTELSAKNSNTDTHIRAWVQDSSKPNWSPWRLSDILFIIMFINIPLFDDIAVFIYSSLPVILPIIQFSLTKQNCTNLGLLCMSYYLQITKDDNESKISTGHKGSRTRQIICNTKT